MRLLNFCLGLLVFLLLVVFLFRVYIVVVLMMYGQTIPTFTIIDKIMTVVAIVGMMQFFGRSVIFDNGTDGCREATNLIVMRNASFVAMVACLLRLVTTCIKLVNETSTNDITIVYVVSECLLWLALSAYFFVYFKDKYMKLNMEFSLDFLFDWVRFLIPGDKKVKYLKKWAKNTVVDGCDKVSVVRHFSCNELYVDLRWWLSPKEGEDPALKTDYYKRSSWESLYENIDAVEKRIIDDFNDK